MPLHQALTRYRDRIRTILPRHEQGGIFAAEGYARASGKPGVVMATSGPGALNLVTGLADAKMDSVPLVAITGQVPRHVIGTDAFQETPMVEVSRAITKHHYLVQDARDIARIVKEAFHLASTGRPGPVLIDMPKDVQNTVVANPAYDVAMDLPGYRLPPPPSPQKIHEVLAAIKASSRPIIYCGGGVVASSAAEELREFAAKTGIPVAMTVHGLGSIPSDHYLSLNMLGMHGTVYANYAVNEADLLLAFGVRFDDRVTGKLSEFAKHGRIVHVDIDASEINKNKFAHIPGPYGRQRLLEGDQSAAFARRLARLAPADRRVASQRPDDVRTARRRDLAPVRPRAVFQAGQGRVHHDDGRRPASDVGRPVDQVQASPHLDHLGRPGVDGLWLARRDGSAGRLSRRARRRHRRRRQLCHEHPGAGDGSLREAAGQGDRAQQSAPGHGRAVGRPVLRRATGPTPTWGPIHHPEAIGQGEGEMPESLYPDFVEIARGFGVKARHVRDKAEVIDALAEMIAHPGPYVLDVHDPLPGARPADDPGGHDGARHHQELRYAAGMAMRPANVRRRRQVALAGVSWPRPARRSERLYFFIFL